VAGQQFGYSFDTIGNRITTEAGGDQWGANLRYENYGANNLNQYTNRTVPGAVDIIGIATNTATVTINNQSSYRKGDYYRTQLPLTNSASAVYQSVTNLAVQNEGTNQDIIASNVGSIFLPQNPESFTYDADGNLTQDGRWTYTWDAENRPIGMTNITGVPSAAQMGLTFGYDYKGRRVSKIVTTAASTNSLTFAYDAWNLIAILNPLSSILDSFEWGTDLSGSMQGAGGVGGLISMSVYGGTNAGNYFYCYDGNGNVAALVNVSNVTVAAQYEYGPFGEVIRATGPVAKLNPFRFSTKNQDDEMELLYYGYRYYNSGTGRWLSRDPVQEYGGVNLYGFIANSPNNHSDLLGLKKKCGVESFTVKWSIAKNKYPDGVTALIEIDVYVKFKNGGDYDQRCCEFKQFVAATSKVNGSPPNISPWHDDGYSRAGDNNSTEFAVFTTIDTPGIDPLSQNDWFSYNFTAEQTVYSPGKSFSGDQKTGITPCDCEKQDPVATKGPHTAIVSGFYGMLGIYDNTTSYTYIGIPADL